ncbi:MAG: helix-turn-helix domain-containing protein [Fimbriimonadaceae bacterium]|nr:helix-turn-helix domain-containing protein [Fimbriimonadaceae bacterium]
MINEGGVVTPLPRGKAFLIPPHVPHEYGVAKDEPFWDQYWAHIADGLLDPITMDWSGATHKASICELPAEEVARAESDMSECYELTRSPAVNNHQFATVLLNSVIARCRHQATLERGKSDPRVETVKSLVAGSLTQANRVTDLARAVNISPSRLTQLFHQEMGMTPQDYVERERLARAARLLLQSDMTLAEVAQNTGFANEFYFSRRFKLYHGVSPGRFRKSRGATIR